jgi:transposase-like protein
VTDNKPKYWSKLIAEQEASKQRIGPFCRERGIGEAAFYYWRKRLRKSTPVQFALLEAAPAATVSPDSALELMLKNGERLRIGNQVEAATLRMVLEAVRG